MRRLEDGIVEAAVRACRDARAARLGLAMADGSGVGSNRHDPQGPSDPQVPVVVVRDRDTSDYLALMVVCNMHATVLHEDTRLVSGDFPAAARQFLQQHVCGRNCPVVYHMGPSGNQSPRHVVRGHTFEEVDRLGGLLGQAIAAAISSVHDLTDIDLGCATSAVELPQPEIAFGDGSGRDAPFLAGSSSRTAPSERTAG